jgi:polysaccharide export outer membrane protein
MIAGCGATGATPGSLGGAPPVAAAIDAYRINQGDKLKIGVFNEPDLTGEFEVNDRGKIGFPLIGEIQADGVLVDEFRHNLSAKLREGFLRNPRVTVDVVNYRPINVIGEVRNAGQYAYRPGLTVQDAIAMAGGYSYRANTSTVYVRRSDQAGEGTVRMDEGRVSVLPGDNIRVPERYF